MTRRARATDARAARRADQHRARRERRKQDVRNQKIIEERTAQYEQAKRTYDMGLRIPGQERVEEHAPSFSKQSEAGLYLP